MRWSNLRTALEREPCDSIAGHAAKRVIVYEAAGLHEGVGTRRTNERETSTLQGLGKGDRL
jgi:hypothetical protein